MEISRLTRDGTAEPVSRDQILRRERGQEKVYFPCSADREQDWQPYQVDLYSAICATIHTYTHDEESPFSTNQNPDFARPTVFHRSRRLDQPRVRASCNKATAAVVLRVFTTFSPSCTGVALVSVDPRIHLRPRSGFWPLSPLWGSTLA